MVENSQGTNPCQNQILGYFISQSLEGNEEDPGGPQSSDPRTKNKKYAKMLVGDQSPLACTIDLKVAYFS
jgi:hypothetical protein